MELKEFIKASLTEVCLAIEEANSELSGSKAVINPSGVQVNSGNSQSFGRESDDPKFKGHRLVQKIDFDVAVYAGEDKTTGGNGKISIASIGFGGQKETSSSNKSESRLRFSIPVIFPEG